MPFWAIAVVTSPISSVATARLKVVAEGLQGIDKAQFPDVAREAEGKCPISNALRGSLKIELETEVK